ncbi:hypothetical protein CAMRE0001_2626 [Campylobacter rectus RM3267]|uniref:Uncharacterized protein n=1 Tax=Campylobacter rectus RM3267 TaxID=553218 RepID=B9D5Z3_CAMRE|nr:hypothetical protein CAMRE0001_2626 [Campylobacter rectus RM3267]
MLFFADLFKLLSVFFLQFYGFIVVFFLASNSASWTWILASFSVRSASNSIALAFALACSKNIL